MSNLSTTKCVSSQGQLFRGRTTNKQLAQQCTHTSNHAFQSNATSTRPVTRTNQNAAVHAKVRRRHFEPLQTQPTHRAKAEKGKTRDGVNNHEEEEDGDNHSNNNDDDDDEATPPATTSKDTVEKERTRAQTHTNDHASAYNEAGESHRKRLTKGRERWWGVAASSSSLTKSATNSNDDQPTATENNEQTEKQQQQQQRQQQQTNESKQQTTNNNNEKGESNKQTNERTSERTNERTKEGRTTDGKKGRRRRTATKHLLTDSASLSVVSQSMSSARHKPHDFTKSSARPRSEWKTENAGLWAKVAAGAVGERMQ